MVLIMALVGCASHQQHVDTPKSANGTVNKSFENPATSEASIMTNQGLRSFREQYVNATEHKAFAQSDSGAWSWKSNRTTREYAIRNALIDCQKQNKRHEEEYPCKIINVDGKWVGER